VRRTFNLVLAAIVVLAITALPLTATAGQTCGSVKANLGSKADKSLCTASTLAGAKTANWDCDYEGKCETVHMSIDGMTCGSCENTLTAVLSGLEGVVKVHRISHKDGLAVICCDPTKIKGEMLTKAVISKGYKAEIIPAVATLTGSGDAAKQVSCVSKDHASCAKTCGPKAAKACGAKAKTETKDKADGSL